MLLHYYPTSYWSRIVSLALAEKGLAPERRVVDITKNASFDPDYLRVNPRGVVPTLVQDDGTVVWDGPTIVRALDVLAAPSLCDGAPDYLPELEKLEVMLFSYSVWVLGKRGEKSADILADKVTRAADMAQAHPDLRELYERKGRFFAEFRAKLNDPMYVARRTHEAGALLYRMAESVDTTPWLHGDKFGYADCIAVAALDRFVDLGMLDAWNTQGHALHGYFKRARVRASYRAVYVDDPNVDERYRRVVDAP